MSKVSVKCELINIIKKRTVWNQLLDRQTDIQTTSFTHINNNNSCRRNKTVYNIVELIMTKKLWILIIYNAD